MAANFEMLPGTVIVSATRLENLLVHPKLQRDNSPQDKSSGHIKPHFFKLLSDGIVLREDEFHYVLGYN